MQTISRNAMKLSIVLLLVVAMFGAGFSPVQPALAACSPTVTLDLWAKPGLATLYGVTTVNIWGYSSTSGGAAISPGPVLDVNQGDCVAVNLTNNLTETTSLLFQGQSMVPDTAGVAPSGTKQYVFTATNAGTYLYEAGLIPGAQHQAAMGLYGVLIVRPATAGQAYNSGATAYDVESPVVLSEIDPALNNSANPAGFDMRNYAPKYFLINGKAYPDAASIFAPVAGNKVLLRYVNAGLQSHAMSTLGLTQVVIATDGSLFAHPHSMVSETIAPGQTLDALVTVPGSATVGTKYAMYDANLTLRNTSAAGLGGMLTFLTVGAPPPPPTGDTTGPSVTTIGLSPNPTNGSSAVIVSATISDVSSGGSNVDAAEFYIDSTLSSPNVMSAVDLVFDTSTESVTGTISTATLAVLASGNHTIYVRGHDSAGNWGSFLSITLNLDKTGPTTSGLTLSPNPSSGAVSVALTATGNDSASGNGNVTAAEYWVDAGAHTAMTASGSPSPIRNFTATISAGLSMGSHVVSVRSQDSFGNWGAAATINLQVTDTAPPTTSGVSASPNPNNGNQGFNASTPAVRVTASFSDVGTGGSNIVTAEGFLDTVGTTGTGFVFIAADGTFNSPTENGSSDIPLAVIGALSNGNHTIYVHAKDAAGNWSAFGTAILVINKTLYFSTVGNTNPPGVGGSADDADIYFWNGTAFSRAIDASAAPYSLPSGANVDGFDRVDATHFYMSFSSDVTIGALSVQDEDIVYFNNGVWSVYFDGTARGLTANNQDIDAFNISGGLIYFSTVGATNPPGVGGTADAGDIYSWNGTSFSRVIDVSAAPYSLPSGANVDGFVRADATHFYLSFSADTTVPGLGAVQDEDVVYYNAGTWLVYFNGTAPGLTANNQDIDAFDIP